MQPSSLSVRIPQRWIPSVLSPIPFTSMIGFSVVFLCLPKPASPLILHLLLSFLPPSWFPPSLCFSSLPSSLLHPASFYLTCLPTSFLVPYLAANSCSLPYIFLSHSSLNSHLLSCIPSAANKIPFHRTPFPASLHLLLLLLLASSISRLMHSSLSPLRALFCLNQELKCCILTKQCLPFSLGLCK